MENTRDKFVDMVHATAEVDIRLSDFHPRSALVTPIHEIKRARFPVIDYHNHIDSMAPREVLAIMDQCGVEHVVNITMKLGQEALDMMDRFHGAAAGRFSTIGWMDWSDVVESDFNQRTVERLRRMVEHGAIGIKFWKDIGLTVRGAQGALLSVDAALRAYLRRVRQAESYGHVSHSRSERFL